MGQSRKRNVVFLPGGIQPVELQYAPLLKVLNGDLQPLMKDLEVYRDSTPPISYTLLDEIEGLNLAVNERGMDQFHMVAYSGGGAVALAYTATNPDKVLSLALSEPAVIPSQEWFQQESTYWQEMNRISKLPDTLFMQEFTQIELREGVVLPPPPAGDPPPWMARRPAGIKALVKAFGSHNLSYNRLRAYSKPVYIAVTGLSNPVETRKAEVLNSLFPDCQVELYPDRHHFDPPQRHEPEHFASALTRLWEKSGM